MNTRERRGAKGRSVILIRLLPGFHARPWGRRTFAPYFDGVDAGAAAPIGEVWLSSVDCRIEGARAPAGARTLGELWERMSASERGTTAKSWARFPLLAKLLFTSDKLSVQVHPDDEYARAREGEPWGKSEVWYVLEAEPGAWVGVGLAEKLERSELEARLGTAAVENALRKIGVGRGDVVSVPAGTLHSIGPGLVLCEIQQYSDVTYRVYDYDRPGLDGRPRALQVEKAREVVKLETPRAGLCAPAAARAGSAGRVLFTGERFAVERYESGSPVSVPSGPAHFDLLVTLEGAGAIRAGGEEMKFRGVEAFLLAAQAHGPEALAEVAPDEPSQWLRAYPVGRWG